jgi:hypothetical protein
MNGLVEVRAGVEFAAGIERADAEAQEKRMRSLGCPESVLQKARERRAARAARPRTAVVSAEDAVRRKRADELGRAIIADDVKSRIAGM